MLKKNDVRRNNTPEIQLLYAEENGLYYNAYFVCGRNG